MLRLPANQEVQNSPPSTQNYSNGLLRCQRCPIGVLPPQRRDDQCSSLLQYTGRRKAVPTNRPPWLNFCVIIFHDNVKSQMTKQWFKQYTWEVLEHPTHSPDMAPWDFHHFEPIRWPLAGQWFQSDNDVAEGVINWLHATEKDFFAKGLDIIISNCDKCISRGSYCVEK